MSKKGSSNFISALCLLLFMTVPSASGQYSEVRRISAQTSDGLVLSVWIEPHAVKFGQEIAIHYRSENKGDRTIYLVHESPLDIRAEAYAIIIGAPNPFPIEHGEYNFSFTKIGRGRNHQGKFTIPHTVYDRVGQWRVEIGFGYVTDITGLDRQLKPGEDPAVLKAPLDERLKTLQLGNLTVDIAKR